MDDSYIVSTYEACSKWLAYVFQDEYTTTPRVKANLRRLYRHCYNRERPAARPIVTSVLTRFVPGCAAIPLMRVWNNSVGLWSSCAT